MGFFSTFAQELINGETIETNIAEVQSPSLRVVELESKDEVEEREIAA